MQAPVDGGNVGGYVGASGRVGLVGMHRCWQEYTRLVNPVTKTHSAYSFVLLNVRWTVEERVLYSPKPAWEDIDFASDLMHSGFEVVPLNPEP